MVVVYPGDVAGLWCRGMGWTREKDCDLADAAVGWLDGATSGVSGGKSLRVPTTIESGAFPFFCTTMIR